MTELQPYLPARQRALIAARVGLRLYRSGRTFQDALSAARVIWSGNGGGTGYYGSSPSAYSAWYGTLPGTQFDYAREVRDPTLNSAVSCCLNWVCRQLSEPTLKVGRVDAEGKVNGDVRHPMLQLLRQPYSSFDSSIDGDALLASVYKSYAVAGMAYILKVGRTVGGFGPPKNLVVLPYWQVGPVYSQTGEDFLQGWRYRPTQSGSGTIYEPKDMIVLRFDLNPYDQGRTSTQPLYPILRSIFGDNEAESFTAAILKNMGVPGHLLVPMRQAEGSIGEEMISPENAQQLEERWYQKFAGDRRGSIMISQSRIEAVKLGLSPNEMAIKDVRSAFEARICSAIGIPAQVVGLQSGEDSKTYANQEEARRSAYEDCVTPFLERFALAMQLQLLPDFGLTDGIGCEWDYSRVPCMQENLGEKAKWVSLMAHRGIFTRDDCRIAMGLEPLGGEEGEELAPIGGVNKGSSAGASSKTIEGTEEEDRERED